MIFFENILLAFQSLRANPLRSILTLVGIAVGIGAVLYVVVLGEITQQRINERLESLGSNILLIRPGYSRMRGVRTAASRVNLKWSDAKEIYNSSNVITEVAPTYSGQGVTEFEDQSWTTKITGTIPPFTRINNEKLIEGRFLMKKN